MYNIGDIFRCDNDFANKAKFCNENNLRIVEIEPDNIGRRFQIQELPIPTKEEFLSELRIRRDFECFSIVNRGQVWYDKLTQEEKYQLSIWYQSWLDVTITNVIPNKPSWLK